MGFLDKLIDFADRFKTAAAEGYEKQYDRIQHENERNERESYRTENRYRILTDKQLFEKLYSGTISYADRNIIRNILMERGYDENEDGVFLKESESL